MWALVDCDNFFCSCERIFRPDLNGRPVVVLSNNDGCVVARSKEAKQLGIKMGLPYYQMLEQFPHADITPFSSNYRLYADISARVMAVIRDESPALFQYSIDEAFINLSGIPPAQAAEWGHRMAAKVKKWVGAPISIGVAPSKTLAKVASKFAKKYPAYHKCCVIHSDEQRTKALSLIDAGDVWGIGRRISQRLAAMGILSALDFAMRPRRWVKEKFHIPGERTWLELNGHDVIDVEDMEGTTKQSIMTSRSFPDMITTINGLRPHIANYAARCASKLRGQHSACSMLSVFIQSNHFRDDLPQYGCNASYLFSTPTNTTTELVEAADKVLEKIYRPGIHYKRAGVMVADISSANIIQPDLFEYDPVKAGKLHRISATIDSINLHLGADMLTLASQQYPLKDENGKNIKFSNAIKRALKSPDYSTSINSFLIS